MLARRTLGVDREGAKFLLEMIEVGHFLLKTKCLCGPFLLQTHTI